MSKTNILDTVIIRDTLKRLIIYTGLDLDEKASILRVFYSRQETFDWMRKVAEENKVHPSAIDSDADLYEVMIDHFDIQVEGWFEVKIDPSAYGNWDEDSLWAMVNDDFSRLTQERWEKLKKRIHFPRVGEGSDVSETSLEGSDDLRQSELMIFRPLKFASVENMKLHASQNYRSHDPEFLEYFNGLISFFGHREGQQISDVELDFQVKVADRLCDVPEGTRLSAILSARQILLDRDTY